MANTSMNIRMDAEVKRQAEILFSEIGINMTTAINIFLKQAIRENGIPFELKLGYPNATTIEAFKEGDNMLNDPASPRYSSVDDLFEDLMN